MEDYVINLTEGGEFGVCAQTEHAENRTPGGLKQGYTLAFKSRVEIVQYVRASEAQGFTFAGKELLSQ